MAPDVHAPASVLGLVELMYQAEWTSLSLAIEVTEFDDYDARGRIQDWRRPSWAPPPGPFPDRPGRAGKGHPGHWHDQADEDEDEDDQDDEDCADAYGSARNVAYRLLIAPGGRFRREARTGTVSDTADRAGQVVVPPCDELLLPSWLPADFELELAGPAVLAGRRAHRVIGRPRPVGRGRRTRPGRHKLRPGHRLSASARLDGIDRIDAIVDAELGILLRSEQMHRGQVVSRREITELRLDPPEAADDAQFTAPPDEDAAGSSQPFSGPGWERVKSVTNAGASAMSFAVRHAPHREPQAGSRPGGPPSYPSSSRDTEWPGPPGPDEPISAEIVGLLYEAGLRDTGLDAELCTWVDAAAAADALRTAARKTTLAGLSQLSDALSERATTWQGREAISLGLPSMYRIDYIDGGMKRRKSTTEASDGTTRWRVFADHVTAGPALPLPEAVARLADPSWLLDWRLTGGAEVMVGDRHGYQIRVAERYQAANPHLQLSVPAEAVLDGELGVLLRLTQERDGRPSVQQALSDVTVRPHPDAADFRIEIAAGTRVIQDSGTVLDLAELSAPAQSAVNLTVKALATATRVGGFLESLRQSGKRPGPGP